MATATTKPIQGRSPIAAQRPRSGKLPDLAVAVYVGYAPTAQCGVRRVRPHIFRADASTAHIFRYLMPRPRRAEAYPRHPLRNQVPDPKPLLVPQK